MAPACELTVTTTTTHVTAGRSPVTRVRVTLTGPDLPALVRAWREMGTPGAMRVAKSESGTHVVWATGVLDSLGDDGRPPLGATQPDSRSR